MPSQTAVVVLAAGAGTRMRSKTPKMLHTLAGRTLLAHTLYACADLGPDHLVAVVGHDRDIVSEAAAGIAHELGRTIATAVQEQQHGTGHAVQCGLMALPADFDGTVIVTTADAPLLDGHTLKALLDEHLAKAAAATVLTFAPADPTGYGRIVRSADGDVLAIVEQADASAEQALIGEVNSGVYAFDASALRTALDHLGTDNAQHELYLTDVLAIAHERGLTVCGSRLGDPDLATGVNDRVQLAHVGALLNRRIVERHMRAGVTVVDPATTWIDIGVTIGRDVRIEPGVQLLGGTHIAEDAVIGPDSTLRDVIVGERASVIRSNAEDSTIGADATVGPFTFIRPGTTLGASGKLGAYVETKNADIGAFTKVPHLSYVGDATIGEHTNIGCSNVFANYDGVNKARIVVGSHVRTGSDTTLVAPVEIGDGAYTGAGTVVRQDVPPGALAVSRGIQRNIEGWTAKNRPGSDADRAQQESKDGKQQ